MWFRVGAGFSVGFRVGVGFSVEFMEHRVDRTSCILISWFVVV